jgi:NADH-quinone oxidoreductase subunit L
VFHLFTHAFFKACLFLGSGSVSHAVHSFDMKTDMGGLRKQMPHTYRTFLVASIALMGIPPLAGFWSKDEILAGSGGWGLFGGTGGNGAYTLMLIMGLVGAAVTGAYMTRVLYLTFFGEFRGHGEPHESGPRIIVPLYILAAMAVVAGLFNMPPGLQRWPDGWEERFGHYVEPVAPYFPAISHATPSWTLAIVSVVVALAGIGAAYWYYFVLVDRRARATGEKLTELDDGPVSTNGLAKAGHDLLVNKYYLDHLYTDIIVGATKGPIARAAYWTNQEIIDGVVDGVGETSAKLGRAVYDNIDQGIVDGIVDASGRISDRSGEELRHVQTGKVQHYAALLFAGATLLAAVFIVYLSL